MTSVAYGDTKLLFSTENLWVPALWKAESELASQPLITRAALGAEELQNPAARQRRGSWHLTHPRMLGHLRQPWGITVSPFQPSPLNLYQAGGRWGGDAAKKPFHSAELRPGEDESPKWGESEITGW